MLFSINKPEQEIFEMVRKAASKINVDAYAVGGFVRDKLLGRPCNDIDIVCVGSGIDLANEIASMLKPIPRVTVFSRFGTAMLKHKSFEIEFVGARKESYSSDSRKPMVEDGSLEDDQNRRDFTVNALAMSLNEVDYGEIIDPFNGLEDLTKKILRTPLAPDETFSDDPLRMMRAIRFASQLNFTIEKDTFNAINRNKSRIRIVSRERITTEMNKILMSAKPSVGFKLMFDSGLLEMVFPELCQLYGVDVKNGVSHKDNFYHTLEVLDNLSRKSDDLWLRWSALLHDIAKPLTKRFDPEVGWTFHGHEALGAAMVPRIFKYHKLPLDNKMKFVQKMVQLHLRPISLTKEEITDSAVRRLLFDAGEDIDSLMMLCEADITSKNEFKVHKILNNYELVRQKLKEVEENDKIRNWQPPVTGELIMQTFGIGPSREVGEIKNAIREAILEGDIPNEFPSAFDFMVKQGKKIGLKVVDDPK